LKTNESSHENGFAFDAIAMIAEKVSDLSFLEGYIPSFLMINFFCHQRLVWLNNMRKLVF